MLHLSYLWAIWRTSFRWQDFFFCWGVRHWWFYWFPNGVVFDMGISWNCCSVVPNERHQNIRTRHLWQQQDWEPNESPCVSLITQWANWEFFLRFIQVFQTSAKFKQRLWPEVVFLHAWTLCVMSLLWLRHVMNLLYAFVCVCVCLRQRQMVCPDLMTTYVILSVIMISWLATNLSNGDFATVNL